MTSSGLKREQTELGMSKEAREELVKRKLDLQFDRELEDTFPASDALKITRSLPENRSHASAPSTDSPPG
jgi:hypothetical protein